MATGITPLLQAVYGADELADVSVDRLRELTEEYPCFNAAQFLLAAKLKEQGDPGFPAQAQRTALYFNNPFWLQWQLTDKQAAAAVPVAESYAYRPAAEEPVSAFAAGTESVAEEAGHFVAGEPAETFVHAEPVAAEKSSLEDRHQGPAEPEPAGQEEAAFGNTGAHENDHPTTFESDTVVQEEAAFGNTGAHEEPAAAEAAHFETPVSPEERPADEAVEDVAYEPENDPDGAQEANLSEDGPAESEVFAGAAGPALESGGETWQGAAFPNAVSPEREPLAAEAVTEIPVAERQPETPGPVFEKPEHSIVFTPYHMIDYFASQGIRLELDENPPDAFGKQLKSFTEWLKVLKKTPLQAITPIRSEDEESKRIAGFAAHSVEEKDILTETMAEVLAKQGMFENAIALYDKLGLLYPAKSAYFASRIEQIKQSMK